MESNNKEYRNTATGDSNKELIEIVENILPQNSTLLVLGIGSGRDITILSEKYKVTGSDFSKLLLTFFAKSNPNIELLNLDPVELSTENKFDSIFSNKVLNQMDEEDLNKSLSNQYKILNENGLIFHSFWSGQKEENHHGLKWVYYTEEKLKGLVPEQFKIIDIKNYKQNLDYDSLCLILKK